VLLVQDQATWRWQLDVTRAWRTQLPADVEWLDHHTAGPTALFAVFENASEFNDLTLFNRNVRVAYSPPEPPLAGRFLPVKHCGWAAGADGALTFDEACGPAPRRLFVNDPSVAVTFHDERSEARDPRLGRVVALGSAPRLESLVVLPCNRPHITFTGREFDQVPASAPRPCRGSLDVRTWVDAPTTLAVRFRGGSDDHNARVGQRVYPLPANRETTIRLPVARGAARALMELDWTTSAGAPEIERVDLGSTRVV
jgi:hypothetical protein